MKLGFTILMCFISFQLSFAQQDKQLSHYIFDRMSFNPATTGFKGYCGTFIYRNQWDRVQDAPNTTLLNIQGNFPRQNFGAGVSFTNDAIGFQRTNILSVNAAYHLPTPQGILSGGIGVGIVNVGFSPVWVPPQFLDDPALLQAISGTAFDLNLGFFWHGTSAPYYVGLSTTHLAPATLENINFSVARHYYILAGYDFELNLRRKIDLKPSMLIKADGANAVFDVNVMANFWLNNSTYLWGGFTYRMADAISLNLGYAFSPAKNTTVNMMQIGYSFDIMTNPLNTYGKGTHELMLNFCIYPPPKGIGKHGNPFILK
jgi:type IX secretion system PorP/SprF family membrane protein